MTSPEDHSDRHISPSKLAEYVLRKKFPGQGQLPGLDGHSKALIEAYARGVDNGNSLYLALETSYEANIADEAHLLQVKRTITAIKDACEHVLENT